MSKWKYSLLRKPNSHKGDYGHVLFVAGSRDMMGAAILSIRAAFRCGLGKATAVSTSSTQKILLHAIPECMTLQVPESKEGSVSYRACKKILQKAQFMDAIVIGPGLSQNLSTQCLVQKLIPRLRCPIILDADGLNAIRQKTNLLNRAQVTPIITPHEGEFKRLFEAQIHRDLGRKALAKYIANKYHCILVQKGFRSLVSGPDQKVYENKTGNPGMAVGGMGDILTGMIASFVAQKFEPFFATQLAVYLHGMTGDRVAKNFAQTSVDPTLILSELPKAIKKIEQKKDLRALIR